MYVYNHRLFDRYGQEVISLVVLGDNDIGWRPTGYSYSRWGFSTHTEFPTVKLLDYKERWSELEVSSNPFAVLIMAHLSTLETIGNPNKRLQSKLSLVRGLYERGYTRSQILELFRLIEWKMVLPKPLEGSFRQELNRIQEERKVPYIVSFVRDGMAIANRESVVAVLKTRFGTVPPQVSASLEAIDDISVLQDLLKQAVTTASVPEFQLRLNYSIGQYY
jgi:hypothetical protein